MKWSITRFAYDAPVIPTTKLFVSKQFSQLRYLFIIIVIIIVIIIIITIIIITIIIIIIIIIINTKNVLINFVAAIRLE